MSGSPSLDGRVAVVTGAASGMGQIMARSLAAGGAAIAALDINRAGLDRMERESVFGGKIMTVTLDVSQDEVCRAAVKRVIDRFHRIDILVNCAGVSLAAVSKLSEPAKFWEVATGEWLRVQSINHLGAFYMAHAVAPHMIAGSWGRIINVTTSLDTMLLGGFSAYGPAKAALEAGTAIWAKDLNGTGVTVNVLVPGGPTDTAFFPSDRAKPPVLIDPNVMATPVAWLASPASDGITGQRFVARDWDKSLPPAEAAKRVSAPAAWASLAAAAATQRGYARERP